LKVRRVDFEQYCAQLLEQIKVLIWNDIRIVDDLQLLDGGIEGGELDVSLDSMSRAIARG
jgi:hypothetical protein